MLKTILIALLPLLLLLGTSSDTLTRVNTKSRAANTGTIKKMIVADGNVAMDVDLGRLNGRGARGANRSILRFDTERNAFFTVIVYNDELRGPLPSSMKLIPQQGVAALPAKLAASYEQLVVESLPGGGNYDLAVRDQSTGFTFFNIEGYEMAYEPTSSTLTIQMGRLLVSDEFAAALGRRSDAGSLVGQISISATMRPIEVSEVFEGEVVSQKLPPSLVPEPGTVPGPDVVVG